MDIETLKGILQKAEAGVPDSSRFRPVADCLVAIEEERNKSELPADVTAAIERLLTDRMADVYERLRLSDEAISELRADFEALKEAVGKRPSAEFEARLSAAEAEIQRRKGGRPKNKAAGDG